MSIEQTQLRNIIEGALLASGQPMNLNRLKSLFSEEEQPEKEELLAALEAITADCEGRGFELKEVGSGWRFQVRAEVAPWINRLWEEKPQRYSRALLETLALVAYRQPITRGDIEEIRGVAVSSHIIKTLTEREWIKVVGHRDVPGRPSLYATTRQFLDYFNLKSLEELPSLGEIRDLSDINKELDLGVEPVTGSGSEPGDGEAEPADEAQAQTSPNQETADEDSPTADGSAEQHTADDEGPESSAEVDEETADYGGSEANNLMDMEPEETEAQPEADTNSSVGPDTHSDTAHDANESPAQEDAESDQEAEDNPDSAQATEPNSETDKSPL